MSIDWSKLALPKPPKLSKVERRKVSRLRRLLRGIMKTRAKEKAEARALRVRIICEVRAKVWQRDRACICGRCRPSADDEMHEILSRAKTRGLPPEERFNTRNCCRLSQRCHREVTEHRADVICDDPALGADGPRRFLRRALC